MKNFLKSIFNPLLILRSQKKKRIEEELMGVIEKILETQKTLIESQKDERQFLREWITGFQQTTQTPSKSLDDKILENLEYAAQGGNLLAQQIISDEKELKEYINLARAEY